MDTSYAGLSAYVHVDDLFCAHGNLLNKLRTFKVQTEWPDPGS
jgi:hypothetical protein